MITLLLALYGFVTVAARLNYRRFIYPAPAAPAAVPDGFRLVELVALPRVSEDVPPHGPPSASSQQGSHPAERGVLVEPMHHRGGDTEVVCTVGQVRVLESLNADLEVSPHTFLKERGEPGVGLERHD